MGEAVGTPRLYELPRDLHDWIEIACSVLDLGPAEFKRQVLVFGMGVYSSPGDVASYVGQELEPHDIKRVIAFLCEAEGPQSAPRLLVEALEHSYRVHGVPAAGSGE